MSYYQGGWMSEVQSGHSQGHWSQEEEELD